nr:DNA binding protein [Microvirus sp.]
MVRDMVAHTNSDLTLAYSDASAMRSFGLQLSKAGFDRRLAADLMLVQLGTVDDHDGATYPNVCGHDCPVPVCSGVEALDFVKEGCDSSGPDL